MDNAAGTQKGRKAVRFNTKLPMKYFITPTDGKGLKEAIITNMSSTGIRFEAGENLPAGTIIEVKIILRGNKVINAAGKVNNVSTVQGEEGKYYDVGMSFTEIGDTAIEQINTLYYSKKLGSKPSGDSLRGADRRRSERFRVNNAFAKYRRKRLLLKGQWHSGTLKQVSKHGFLVTVKGTVEQGEIWEIIAGLVVYNEPIIATAKVVRVKKEYRTLEVGLEIIKINENDRKKLSKSTYIDRLFLYKYKNLQADEEPIWKKSPEY